MMAMVMAITIKVTKTMMMTIRMTLTMTMTMAMMMTMMMASMIKIIYLYLSKCNHWQIFYHKNILTPILVAQRVIRKSASDLFIVKGKKLSVKVLSSQPCPRVEGEIEPNVLLVKHFSESCTPQDLRSFFELEPDCSISEIIYSLRPSIALMKFNCTPSKLFIFL